MDFLQALLAVLMPAMMAGAWLLAARIEMRIKAVTHAEMESYHRDGLHMAIGTGIKIGVGRLTKKGGMVDDHVDDLKAQAVAYARRSVTDAIAYLSASFEALLDITEAKISDAAPFYVDDSRGIMWDVVENSQLPFEYLTIFQNEKRPCEGAFLFHFVWLGQPLKPSKRKPAITAKVTKNAAILKVRFLLIRPFPT